jgi:23S rRNA (uracil1939-C5)-methyltransferase
MIHTTTDSQQLITLTIEKLVHGGAGLAKHEGKACFIDRVIPGETVRARITGELSQYCNAHLLDILEPSPARIQPACPLAGLCGGCQWQHIAYAGQIACKADIVEDCLKRIGKLQNHTPLPPVPSPLETGYRSRAAFKISDERKPKIGFYASKSHRVVEVHDCLLLEPEILNALQICRRLLQEDQKYAGYTDLQLLAVDSAAIVLGLFQDSKNRRQNKFAINTTTGSMEQLQSPVQEKLSGMKFLRDTDNFYQVNRRQNQAMICKVLEFIAPVSGLAILDMFCGCGNFSLFLAGQGAQVTGIDSNAAAIDEARRNASMNGIENTRFITGDIHRLDENLVQDTYEAVLLNPPRSGCEGSTLKLIASKKPAVIVYVSCNPATLARDLRLLSDSGYAVDEIQPFDMFPQTYHIETIVKLSRQPQPKEAR